MLVLAALDLLLVLVLLFNLQKQLGGLLLPAQVLLQELVHELVLESVELLFVKS